MLVGVITAQKHGSESVRYTESFDSFFVRAMTQRGLKCVTLHISVQGVTHVSPTCIIPQTIYESNDPVLHAHFLFFL